MISIIQHIEYLMIFHDCVVVPGWGALIANHSSATVDGASFNRPSRTIVFNASINHNDGLLANSLMRRHDLNYTQACNIIASNVTNFQRHLANGDELAFGHLGYFKLNANDKLEFTPMAQRSACDEFFGLSSINLNAISGIDAQAGNIAPSITISWKDRVKVAASIAAIVGVGLLLSTPVIIDKSTQSASLNVVEIKTGDAKTNNPVVTVKPVSKTNKADNQISVINEQSEKQAKPSTTAIAEAPEAKDQEREVSPYNDSMPSKGAFFLVINSCSTAQQAAKMSQYYSRQGMKTKVVARGGYHHLVVAQSNSQQELLKIKKSLPQQYKNAWVCN